LVGVNELRVRIIGRFVYFYSDFGPEMRRVGEHGWIIDDRT